MKNEPASHEEKIEHVSAVVSAILNQHFDVFSFNRNSIFNYNDIIASEDAELIFEAIAVRLSVDVERFFTELPIRHYFGKDYGLVALPLLLLAPLFRYMRKDKDEIRQITVRQFSRDVIVKFPDIRPDER